MVSLQKEIQLLKQNHKEVEQKFNCQIAKAKSTYEKKLVSLDADFKKQLSISKPPFKCNEVSLTCSTHKKEAELITHKFFCTIIYIVFKHRQCSSKNNPNAPANFVDVPSKKNPYHLLL